MAITHVKVFESTSGNLGSSTTFNAAATNTGDAVVFFLEAQPSGSTISDITISASGWAFTALVPLFGFVSAATGCAKVYGAIAPNTSSVTFTVTVVFSAGATATFLEVFADEFTGNDQTGGTTTFNANNSGSSASVYANLTITPPNANQAIWFGLSDSMTAASGIYTIGANDAGGDGTEWAILAGNAGVLQTSSWASATGAYLQAGIAINPSGSSAVPGRPTITAGPSYAI